jgi:hypothetical protein
MTVLIASFSIRLTGGDFNFGIPARPRPIEGGNNSVNVPAQYRPLGVSKNNDRYSPTDQILLIPDVLVSCYKYFEAFGLSCVKQSAVSQRVPSAFNRFDNNMSRECMAQRGGRTVIK